MLYNGEVNDNIDFCPVFYNFVQAGNMLSVSMEAQGFEPPTYDTITGCNSDIERQPPMCTYCCKEETFATATPGHKNGLKFSRH
ncbi:hypothetical protein GQ457_02G020770 [Hibiscus cannabinus]